MAVIIFVRGNECVNRGCRNTIGCRGKCVINYRAIMNRNQETVICGKEMIICLALVDKNINCISLRKVGFFKQIIISSIS